MAVLIAPRERDVLAADSPATPTLRLSRRGDEGQRAVPLSSGKYTIGSSPQCQVCVPSPEVRPLQCLITLESGAASVTRWAAGVQLNGKEFSKAELKDGDRLSIGDWEIEFDCAGSRDMEPPAVDDDDSSPEGSLEFPSELAAEIILPTDEQPEESGSFPEAAVESTLAEPAAFHSSQAFADSLVLHLWTANDRARRRGKALITGIRAARFQADAMAADLSALETELDLARAAYDSHLGHDDRLQQELAEQHEQRVAPLLDEIATLQSQLEEAHAHVSRQTAEFETLSVELAVLRVAAQTPEVDLALVKRAEDLEAAVAVHRQELEKVTEEFRLSQQEQQRLAELYRIEAERAAQETQRAAVAAKRAAELDASLAVYSQEREQLASDLRHAQQERERLAALYQSEVVRSAQEAERAAAEAKRSHDLGAVVAAHPHELEKITGELCQARQEQGRLLELYQTEAERAAQETTRATVEAKRAEELEATVAAHTQELEHLTGELRLAQEEGERLAERYQLEAERANLETQRTAQVAKRTEELEAAVAVHTQELEQLRGELRLAQQERERLAELCQLEAERALLETQRAAQEADRAAQLEQQLSDQQAQISAAAEQARAAEWAAAQEQATAAEDPWRDVATMVEAPVEVAEPSAWDAVTPLAVEPSSPSTREAGDVDEPEATTPLEAEQPAPAYTPTSFIDAYRHLLEPDDAPATQIMSAKGGRPIIDDEFLSPAKVETCDIPADESDDALEAYMANMMRRVRSSSPSYVSSQAVPEDEPSGADAAIDHPGALAAYPVDAATDANFIADEPLSLETMRQATRKQPLASDFASLREMANSSARTALATHSERRRRESAITKIAIALTSMASAAYLMASAPAITNWHFWAGVATCAVGITAAVQTLVFERRKTADRAK